MFEYKTPLSEEYITLLDCYQNFLPDAHSILFFDIETTGLFWKNSQIYLIGCIYKEADLWYLHQWFAQSPQEEVMILQQFMQHINNNTSFIHFNGNSFDVPYLLHKFTQYKLDNPFENKIHKDLYQIFSPLKPFLPVPSFKQKDLELYLNHKRTDIYTGKDLIEIYKQHIRTPEDHSRSLLLLHNKEDVLGMLTILQLFGMIDMLQGHIHSCSYSLISSPIKEECCDLLLQCKTNYCFPVPFSLRKESEYITWKDDTLLLKLIPEEGMIKYYFPDYTNYYYLPDEDYAIHKSLGTYVDKSHRIPATKENCYQKILWDPELFSEANNLEQYIKNYLQHL